MPSKWRVQLLRSRSAIKGPVAISFKNALNRFNLWILTELKKALIYGGMGIEGIAQTSFYQWITSADGLSQLGIPPSEPPKLLKSYHDSFKLNTHGSTTGFEFGNVHSLLQATPHPANGTGQLKVGSWMAWVLSGKVVNNYGYVARNKLPAGGIRRKIRLNDPLGGLMLKSGRFGSVGHWQVSGFLMTYADHWFLKNKDIIEKLMTKKINEILIQVLS